MTRALLILAAVLAIAAALLGVGACREHRRAETAVQERRLVEQSAQALQAQVEAHKRGAEALRQERDALAARLRRAGDEAGRIRREGEARVQALLQAPAPRDPADLAAWAAAQAQDLNRRLEAP